MQGDKMRLRIYLYALIALLLLPLSLDAYGQAVESGYERQLPFAVGGGVAGFETGLDPGRLYGPTIWGEYTPNMLPSYLAGLGVEVQYRDVSFDRTALDPTNLSEWTLTGGLIYHWRHFRNFRPYGKFLIGTGSADFYSGTPSYTHDTFTPYSEGIGFDYRVWHHVSMRADYEYQSWPRFLGFTRHPQGFTLGAMYSFSTPHFH